MKQRNDNMDPGGPEHAAPTDLLSALAQVRTKKATAQAISDPRLWRMTVRLPREIRAELRIIAETQGVKVNALIAAALDHFLIANGRRGICEAAPWYAAYLNRQGRTEEDDDDLSMP